MSYIKYEVLVHDNGDREWRLNDKCHREDGPAIEHADGSKSWYLNGKCLTKDKFDAKNNTQDCSDRVIEIDGVEYILKKKGQ